MIQIQTSHVSQYSKNHQLLLAMFQRKIPFSVDIQKLQNFYFCQINFSAQIESLVGALLSKNIQDKLVEDYLAMIYILLINLAIYEVENNSSHFQFVYKKFLSLKIIYNRMTKIGKNLLNSWKFLIKMI